MADFQVFKASHLSQIISLILLWVFFLIAFIWLLFESSQLHLILLFGLLILLLTIWNRSLKIKVDDSGILYRAGAKTKTLYWS